MAKKPKEPKEGEVHPLSGGTPPPVPPPPPPPPSGGGEGDN